MTKQLPLNCDMGEGFGLWDMGDDKAIMPLLDAGNIACGGHAGDPSTIPARAVRNGLATAAPARRGKRAAARAQACRQEPRHGLRHGTRVGRRRSARCERW